MSKTNLVVSGRLLLMGILLVIRWTLWVPYALFLICFTLFESAINGATYVIAYFKKLNNELLTKTE